ncbi:Rho guanine nucleotide exchange factor 7 [Cryptotermes secundus]|uniref:Rho guanine nucleotide exchange factor 7 n=1 Tax=Cryptotermes secundus TaxID=105785 RepID=A0A2J7PLC6_9NEOP|nr:Rho guanine nucleotide exchange factor 7 [Cryptotermes secundus]PNF17136.1 Rho guanine nucleotide exchange factor 7 [Cryptotermes secundus]PNF17137.1 Rho guanine nucleotide exchange factor 7 [Cryptotermes secundus]
MSVDGTPFLVQAVYSFKGKNNDELCFRKGDIITITQREEGGWWEGTLGDKTGWFPSNYVKEYKIQETSPLAGKTSPTKLPPELAAQQKVYRNLVLKDLIDSEKAHVAELQGLLKNFLHPLEKSEILTKEAYRQLVGNINNVVETHQQLLSTLEECNQRPVLEQRVGKVFLTSAPHIKQVHQAYCSSHPKAVCILDKYKTELNEFMESQGAASPGLLVLTTGLSKPFRRLEKYAGMLQELERHVEENHPDRGDTQRSVSVYKDIASSCSATRRQKELELEVLTGGVRGWEGEDLSCLGEILHMGSVAVCPDHRDRYLVLFPSTLLMLSVSQRMSAFIYEGKLPLTGINVTKLEDTEAYKNAFEITGAMIERIIAVCQTKDDQHTWVEHLKQQIRTVRKSSMSSPSPATSPPPGKPQPLPPPHMSPLTVPLSPRVSVPQPSSLRPQHQVVNKGWSMSCLRPSPPLRPCLALGRDDNHRKSGRSTKKQTERSYEEDAQILRVIEAYCTSAKTRYTVNSAALLDSPQMLIAEEEKIIIEETSGNQTFVEEKSLVDTVYALKDQVKELQTSVAHLSSQLEEETKARLTLQNIVCTHLVAAGKEDIHWPEN